MSCRADAEYHYAAALLALQVLRDGVRWLRLLYDVAFRTHINVNHFGYLPLLYFLSSMSATIASASVANTLKHLSLHDSHARPNQ